MSFLDNRRVQVSFVLGAILATFAVFWTGLPTEADEGGPVEIDPVFDCYNFVPHTPSSIRGDVITADIVIARDGISEAKARDIMAKAAEPYAATGNHAHVTPRVKFNIVAVHDLSGKLTGRSANGGYYEGGPPLTDDLMSQMIRYYKANYPGLKRDHVHLITNRDITDDSGDEALLGIDNCIGSIGTKDSFSISESGVVEPFSIRGLVDFVSELDAKVAAHEVGHAFGAHHHYANCLELAVFGLLKGTADVCSLMFNDASLVALRFGTLETLVVRANAERHIEKMSAGLPDLPLSLP
jgi:hypothetical protein